MKIAFKATLAIAVLAILVVALSLSWFYFYSRDLPGFVELVNFAPESAATLADKCYTSTILAGLIKAPAMYSPELHPDRAKMRRDEVVAAMLTRGAITSEQAKAAVQAAVR